MSELEKNIGFLWPCDGLNDSEYWKFLPKDVGWLTARYGANTATEELTDKNLEQYASLDTLQKAVDIFKAVNLDAIACGDHAASFILGKDHEEYLIDKLQKQSGCPVTFPSRSIVRLIKNKNFKDILLVSPYSKDITEKFERYLGDYNIKTIDSISLEATDEVQINSLSSSSLPKLIIDFVKNNNKRAELLVIAGGGISFSDEIARVETILNIPILTAVGALVRDAIELIGQDYKKAGMGRIFLEQKSGQLKKIKKRLSSGTKNFSLTEKPPIFESGVGAVLVDDKNNTYFDFASGSGTTALGHGNNGLIDAVQQQLQAGIFHIGPHFNTGIQADFYSELSSFLPPELSRFHPSISGSEAAEIAIKSAMHFTGAKQFLGFSGGYHGRTLGALAVSGEKGKNASLGPFHPKAHILPFPEKNNDLSETLDKYDEKQLAGVIIEPIQATAGLKFVDKQSLIILREFTTKNKIPLIFDETFTGFCRTGKMFGYEHFDVTPDIIILGKAISAGFPAGLVISTEEILTFWEKGTQSSTFQLNPVAAAASVFFLDQIKKHGLLNNISLQSEQFNNLLKDFVDFKNVTDVRGIGSFWVIEFSSSDLNKNARKMALQNGLITWECGEFGECLGLVPPLNMEPYIIERACSILRKSILEIS